MSYCLRVSNLASYMRPSCSMSLSMSMEVSAVYLGGAQRKILKVETGPVSTFELKKQGNFTEMTRTYAACINELLQ